VDYARQHAHVGEAYLLAGRHDVAARLAAMALEAARAQKQPGQEALALRLSAEVAAGSLDRERAETDYRHALTLASEIRLRPLAAHCHLGLGKLYRRTDKQLEAQEHVTIATTMYREMGMMYWLEKTHREIEELESGSL
jgi:tetratricopeptide (TPR) repeat protein